MPDIQYRREIDGLRAVAVIPVILFHAGFKSFSGGYVGVDVFFVISGFLITSLLNKDLEAGTFTFAGFYERRARRILPALFFVMVCCIPFAWVLMFPLEFKGFASSVLSTCFFVSNIYFWRESGYFAEPAQFIPLLHTWSLAVEEQYYLLFPLFLGSMFRFGYKTTFASIAAITIISFILCVILSQIKPNFNYFWAITRAWELLIGSLCAFLRIRQHLRRDNCLSLLGLASILTSVFVYDQHTPFPSLYALAPVLGTSQ
jgi:peptidoglycan/LPS O-acetylase OafA/YrhL